MAYAVVVLDKSRASRAIQGLQPIVRAAFWRKLQSMDLMKGSRRAIEVRGRSAQFTVEIENIPVYFTVIFRFADSADENTLLVTDVKVTMG